MATMVDGLSTTLVIGSYNFVCEIEVTPPGIDGGEGIPQDCMRSGLWNLVWPKKRRKLTPITVLVSWNPDVYGFNIAAVSNNIYYVPGAYPGLIVNQNMQMYVYFPTGSTLTFYGFVSKFEPQAMKEGERPTANMTIMPSLLHPSTGLAVAPTYVGV